MYFAKPHPGDVTIKTSYGITSNGTAVDEYVLTNANGMEVKIINYGGIITSIRVPDRHGNMANVVLGFNNLHDYETQSPFFGCITGRYANRIAEGKFTLDGVDYTLAQNDGPNSLHGGLKGFDKAVWNAAQVNGSLELTHLSPDMDEGFPGKLNVKVTYALTDQNELVIDYTATTDKPTIVNLTNHSYFNLLGEGMGAIYDHILMLNADHYTPTNSNLIPTGELAPVEGTPFDFRLPKVIGPGQRSSHEQIRAAHGYDHNFVLSRPSADDTSLMLAARVYEPRTGRMMEVWTTEPAIQFYAGNFINATLVGTSGHIYRQSDGLALETQHYPDSPNQPHFPTVRLDPGQTYRTTTIYKFAAD
ncbi:MAG TPA: aldose epimerase family protein [Aggregatilineaceae bacterium]|nr:aldose epimerase family protein [Aggregatilineaceae bacterium]